MKIKKNGKVINLTESDLKRIVKEQSKEPLKMDVKEHIDQLEGRISVLEDQVKDLIESMDIAKGMLKFG
jgi:chaperonin cofactor prefoldin